MLPELDEKGELPAGVHAANLAEVAIRFGQGTPARVRAMTKLGHLHQLAVRTGKLRSLYVFGSFVSSVAEPRDVDLLIVMAVDFRLEDCPRECRTLFSHPDAEARYGASVFWLREGMLSETMMREFLETWQMKRDGTKRGIVELKP